MNSRSRRLALLSLMVVSTSAFIIAAAGSSEKDAFARARKTMVEQDIGARGVRDQNVLAAMLKVPRHLFVDEHLLFSELIRPNLSDYNSPFIFVRPI